MSTKYQKEDDDVNKFENLGYYVEGDYMVEEPKLEYKYVSPVTNTGYKLEVVDQSILIIGPNKSTRTFTFDTKAEWEGFCEAIWKTEHYVAVKKKDFIEFFRALRDFRKHHCKQFDAAIERQKNIQEELDKQQSYLNDLAAIVNHYEDLYMEVYNENKVQ